MLNFIVTSADIVSQKKKIKICALNFTHTPIFDYSAFGSSVENPPSHERGIFIIYKKFPFRWKGWQSRNEIDGVGQLAKWFNFLVVDKGELLLTIKD